MSDALTAWSEPLFIFALCVPRILAMLMVLPFASPATLSHVTRAAIAVSLALIVYPLAQDQYPADGIAAGETFLVITKETIIGFLIGYLVSVLFWAVQAIGLFIDTHRGATLAGALQLNFSGDQSSPLGILLLQVFTVLFFIGGGAVKVLEGLYQSYQAWPLFSFFPRFEPESARYFITQLDLLTYIAVFLAGPAIVAMFLAEMGLALMNRFVPQLQVFFLALPVKSALAFLVLALYASTLIYFLGAETNRFSNLFTDLNGLLQ